MAPIEKKLRRRGEQEKRRKRMVRRGKKLRKRGEQGKRRRKTVTVKNLRRSEQQGKKRKEERKRTKQRKNARLARKERGGRGKRRRRLKRERRSHSWSLVTTSLQLKKKSWTNQRTSRSPILMKKMDRKSRTSLRKRSRTRTSQ